jgi:uracil-DNA glycosylase family 4
MALDPFNKLNQEIIACRKCPRLAAWREEVARTKRKAYRDWDYWAKPVPGFGDPKARLLVVGLAPGAHGSNRTGRQFTGDASGKFLYPALYRAGFANQPDSTHLADGLTLQDVFITASGRCAPPGNKPTNEELDRCQPFLEREIELIRPKVMVCLGRVAFDRVMKIYSRRLAGDDGPKTVNGMRSMVFAHGAAYKIPAGALNTEIWLLCSYHPSQQNTLTGRLTVKMFDEIWKKAKKLLNE